PQEKVLHEEPETRDLQTVLLTLRTAEREAGLATKVFLTIFTAVDFRNFPRLNMITRVKEK
ncbi:MAG: hypothetical protein QG576_120, partial [Bacteroidota bacterium]|nr:hypothetical protein [Bacteroidota bacterium]